jgi:hypothetical protein
MKVAVFKFITEENFVQSDAEKLRGFMGNKYQDNVLFHNHLSLYEFLYKSPLIQYKVLDKKLCIIGINEGIEVLKENIMDLREVDIKNNKISILNIQVEENEKELKVGASLNKYKFETLWIALNSNNYSRYKKGEYTLDKALVNNLLEIFSMEKIFVEQEILAKGTYNTHTIIKKDTKLLGISGEFISNVELPDYISLGKRKSIGFGTIKCIG